MPPQDDREVLPKPLRVVLLCAGGFGCAAIAAATACGSGIDMLVWL